VILVGNHNNQFVDGIMFLTVPSRHVRLLMAAKSLLRAGVGWFGAAMRSIPVRRPQDEDKPGSGQVTLKTGEHGPGTRVVGDASTRFTAEAEEKGLIAVGKSAAKIERVVSDTELELSARPAAEDTADPTASAALDAALRGEPSAYRLLPHIKHDDMYSEVFKAFRDGAVVGIFPEGGSHDRAELLPIKAGVAIMAFEAMRLDPSLEIPIVPCGLNYYRGHRFRGRCVLFFGPPCVVTRVLFEQYLKDKKTAVANLMEEVRLSLSNVVLEFPDHRTFRIIQTLRNLFKPEHINFTSKQHFQLMISFKKLHNATKEEPKMKELSRSILEYHDLQWKLGVGVGGSRGYERSAFGVKPLLYIAYLVIVSSLALIPGLVLNLPVGVIARLLSLNEKKRALAKSSVKRTGKDVVASYKILVSFFLLPAWYMAVSLLIIFLTSWHWTRIFLAVLSLPLFSYLGVMFTEQGVITSKKLYPMLLRLIPWRRRDQDRLRDMRRLLQAQIREFVDKYGTTTEFYSDCPVTREEVMGAKFSLRRRFTAGLLSDEDVIPSC
jgi:glycerol-3-phosphate O-acyltransferase/dihydroxyacetone phosphate acyltransferase